MDSYDFPRFESMAGTWILAGTPQVHGARGHGGGGHAGRAAGPRDEREPELDQTQAQKRPGRWEDIVRFFGVSQPTEARAYQSPPCAHTPVRVKKKAILTSPLHTGLSGSPKAGSK